MADKKRGILLSVLVLFSILILSGLVSGACNNITWNNPNSSQSIKGSINFNVTVASNGTDKFNVTLLYATSATGVFTSFSANLTNVTGANGTANFRSYQQTAFSTSSLGGDSSGYRFNASIYNYATGSNDSCTVTGLIVDNTNPTSIVNLPQSSLEIGSPLVVKCGSSTDSLDTALTYNITLYGVNKTTYQNQFTATIFKQEVGSWKVNCLVCDDLNNCDWDANKSLLVTSQDGRSQQQQQIVEEQKAISEGKGFPIIPIFVIFIAIIAILILIVTKKKR